MLVRAPEDARGREIVAEGWLCQGLERDDAWALARALEAFQARLTSDPDDFFARLYAAAALQRRFPLSDNAVAALDSVRAALATADVGAARAALGEYIAQARAELTAHRAQFLPLLAARERGLHDGTLVRAELIDRITLLAETGPEGVDRARDLLDARLAALPDAGLETFYRAELLRGHESPDALAARYRAGAAALCGALDAQSVNECQRARWRLEQLDRAAAEAAAEREGE